MREVRRHRYLKFRVLWLNKKTSTSEIVQMNLFMAIFYFLEMMKEYRRSEDLAPHMRDPLISGISLC